MIEIKKFTEEQLERANNVDLARMLMSQGEKLKKEGIVYRWMRYDSTVIHGNEWYRHSRETGGGPIQFMEHFYGMNFIDAVKYLLNGEDGVEFVQAETHENEKKEFVIPEFSKNMHKTFAYLCQTRKIDADVVDFFVSERKIYETKAYSNVAFCGYDENGDMKNIHLRSTRSNNRFFLDVEGSDKAYYFRHIGTNDKVFVFEAPIDMLSYISMNKENWKENNYVCLGGVSFYSLENILNNKPDIKEVYLCLDNDKRGHEACEKLKSRMNEMKLKCERLVPENKDWNEDLQELSEEQNQDFELTM